MLVTIILCSILETSYKSVFDLLKRRPYTRYIWIENKCLINDSGHATVIKSCRNPSRGSGGETRWQTARYDTVDVYSIYETVQIIYTAVHYLKVILDASHTQHVLRYVT